MLNFKQVLSLIERDQRYRDHLAVWLGFFLLLYCYHLIFGQFFPTKNGTMGHDWSWIIPSYLRSYADYLQHGIPFFSNGSLFRIDINPAACHGLIYYLFALPHDPVSLLIWMGFSPVTVAYLQFLMFASIGFWGMFVLLSRVFMLTLPVALLGAGMFMFNGFYAHRIIIGHLYFAVMLLPLLAFCLTYATKVREDKWQALLWGVLAGVVAYYAFTFRVSVIIVPFVLTLVAVLGLWLIRGGGLSSLLARSIIAMLVASALAYQYLYAFSISVSDEIAITQRISYSFPAFRDVGAMSGVLFEMLFFSPEDIERIYLENIVNLGVAQQRHELEYGISVVPLLLLTISLLVFVWRWLHIDHWGVVRLFWGRWLLVVLIVVVLLFPIIYTTNFPELLSLIKKIPLINATTSPQRTYFIYVFLLPFLSILAISRVIAGRWMWAVAIACLGVVVLSTASTGREFYHAQPYDPKPVQEAHHELQNGRQLPPIDRIGILGDGKGGIVHDQMVEANLFLEGVQHLGCYIPGYSSVPTEFIGSLHPGSIWDETDGYLNIKNPACINWPKENNCRPGDHFTVQQKSLVERYIHYEPFPVKVPEKVRMAAYVSAFAFFSVMMFLLGYAVVYFRTQYRR